MVVISVVCLLLVVLPVIIWLNTSGIERLLFILAISAVLFCFLFVLAFIPILVGSLAGGVSLTKKEGEDGKRPFVFQVPKNHKWVIRNVWRSDPVTLEGYEEKNEGWNYYIPTLWQSDEGLVDLTPKQLDPGVQTINCKDGNDVHVDVRSTYFIRTEKDAAIKYIINTSNKNIEELIKQRIKVAVNQAMDVNSNEAIQWGELLKKAYSDKATEIINQLLCCDHDKDYGLQATIHIENIEPTPEVKAAADRNTAETYDQKAMKKESSAMANMIKKTGASPTFVMIAQILADALRGKERKGKA